MDKKSLFSGISDSAQDFIKQLIVVNVEQRMSIEQALQHAWI